MIEINVYGFIRYRQITPGMSLFHPDGQMAVSFQKYQDIGGKKY